jgi:hypothetical protein
MPFVVKDVLQHKRNERQQREIHEQQYLKYLVELRRHRQSYSPIHSYYLSSTHADEIERSRHRHALAKQTEYTRIQRENVALYDRLSKASQRTLIDDRNHVYERNLRVFNSKYHEQRHNQYKRIDNENQALLQRIRTARGRLVTKEECDRDWRKNVNIMKKMCAYPENIDRVDSATYNHDVQRVCLFAKMRRTQSTTRQHRSKSPFQQSYKPLAFLLD